MRIASPFALESTRVSAPRRAYTCKTALLGLAAGLLAGGVLLGAPGPAAADAARLDPIAPRLATADPRRGATVFLQCQVCHTATPGARHPVGPNLWNVVGRPVAAQPEYKYSDSLQAIGGIWDFETLSRYLFDPVALAPNTRMVFGGLKGAQERADLIAYLTSLSDSPLALPEPDDAVPGPVYGDLPEGEGREAVYFTCRACHALDQFTHLQHSRAAWDEVIDEMIAKNGMAAPEPWARTLMLDYLGQHFGAPEPRRLRALPAGPGREEVYYTCSACHSIRMVTQQRLSRTQWEDIVDWMVSEQGMDPIEDTALRERILDYLATQFGDG